VNNALAFINLALALGKAGKPHCGYGCLTGQGNGQGGREHGQKADQLPGYRRLDNPEHRAHIARIWGVAEPDLPAPGLSAYEMLDAMGSETGVRVLLVFGSNLVISAPHASHIEQRLAKLDFLMVSDFFLSETAELADVALRGAMGRRRRHYDQSRRPRPSSAASGVPAPRRSHRPGDSGGTRREARMWRTLPVTSRGSL
jgi:assimilatory nitrate reductase catalytic subunit